MKFICIVMRNDDQISRWKWEKFKFHPRESFVLDEISQYCFFDLASPIKKRSEGILKNSFFRGQLMHPDVYAKLK